MVQSLVMEAAVADTKIAAMRDAVRCILSALGEDVNREGLRDTPKVEVVEFNPHDNGQLLACALTLLL
jgi:GTP cyclohydrolase I